MYKIIHASDLHFSNNHKYSVKGSRLRQIYKTSIRIVKYAIKNKVDMIVICGDLADNYNPDSLVLRYLTKFFQLAIKNNIKVRAIMGDHDTDGINYSLESVHNIISYNYDKKLFKIIGVNDGELYEGEFINFKDLVIHITYVPWQKDIQHVFESAKQQRSNAFVNLLFSHCGVDKALSDTGYKIESAITVRHLSGWNYVGLGDYHTWQIVDKKNNIYYSGSTNRITWSERLEQKSFNLVTIGDDKKIKVKRVILPDIEFIEAIIDYKKYNKYVGKRILKYNNQLVKDSFVRLYIKNVTGFGENIIHIKQAFIKGGAADVYDKIIKSEKEIDTNYDSSIKTSLDVKDYIAGYCKKKNKDQNYIDYGIKKIMEIK